MIALIIRRLAQVPAILLVIYTMTFLLAWMIPGNPLEKGEGRRPPDEIMQAMMEQYRLDSSWSFYWQYLEGASGIRRLRGRSEYIFDLGPSLSHENWSVNEILAAGLPVSMTVGLLAMTLACAIGLVAGIIGGVRPRSVADFATLIFALLGISLPTFVIGTGLLVAFSVMIPLFPVGGWGTPAHLILPAITLAMPFAAYIARLTRFGMIEQMESEYVRAALARGLSERQAALRHALRNAFLPVLSYLGPASAMAMTGSFVVEKVFALPGIGTHFVDAVLAKDITLIMGVSLTFAVILILFNLAVDVLYHWIDPRIRVSA